MAMALPIPLYFKIPNQSDPNVTYYAAVRVIDSNSAINASTAWNNYNDVDGDPAGTPTAVVTPNTGAFASNVGFRSRCCMITLFELAETSLQMMALNRFRFNWSGMGLTNAVRSRDIGVGRCGL